MIRKTLDLRRHLPGIAFVLVLLLLLAATAAAFVYGGIYNIGADAPHSKLVYATIEELREQSVERHSRNLVVPKDLGDAKRIETGAGLYEEMCTGCHLGPGVEPSELSQGLYPPAPQLAKVSSRPAAQQFWIIKHGIKLSAMPAWGKTHSDELIWDMVAFIRQLPRMSPQQYRAALANAPADHDEIMKEMMPPAHGAHSAGTAAPADRH
ncbi:MAG TPA: cytochrome c [Sphingomicrobium sp.]|nr:cytochrome c [Sphingomicrobium sp.]